MNTKSKGDKAVGQAINYYLSSGYEVSLPIGDKRSYDFLIENNGKVEKVQVKYAGYYSNKNKCLVGLRITGGNQSFHYSKKYGEDDFDYLFVYTEKGDKYNIPWKNISAKSEISIDCEKFSTYKV